MNLSDIPDDRDGEPRHGDRMPSGLLWCECCMSEMPAASFPGGRARRGNAKVYCFECRAFMEAEGPEREETRTCRGCGVERPVSRFPPTRIASDHVRCFACRHEASLWATGTAEERERYRRESSARARQAEVEAAAYEALRDARRAAGE